jgi:hypothetical protein
MTKKKDKKKLILVLLLLVALVGVTGYGVYSYYYTQGDVQNESQSDDENVIRITGEFDPEVDGGGDSSSGNGFLGNGGTLSLTCPDTASGHGRITCNGSITVRNDGTTPIYVSVYSASAYTDVITGNVALHAGDPSFNWENGKTLIQPGNSETLSVSVDVSVGSDGSIDTDQGQLVTAPVSAGDFKANVSFTLKASQREYDY